MKVKKVMKRFLWIIGISLLFYVIRYCYVSFPIATGYGAKVLCSAVFVSGRNEKDIKAEDLSFTPLNLASFTVNYTDSSVTGSLFGLAKRTAIYRKGLGATLISELSEEEVRAQQFHLATPPPINTDSIAWPDGDKLDTTFPAAVNKHQLAQAVEAGFVENDADNLKNTRAVVVLYNGQLVAEKYAPGFTAETKLTGWSMTKSITGALIGILVKEGKLQIDKPAPVPEWQNPADPRHAITIKHLLQQSSGLNFEEAYGKSADATKMLFQRANMGAFTASHDLKNKPGEVFYYSSGNSNILSRIILHTVGRNQYYIFPYQQLFYKLGMYHTVMEPDASGVFVGSSYCYATARDWARFGLLYLNDGVHNGERILPEGWVAQTVVPASGALQGQYGYQFWLNKGQKGNEANRVFPSAPTDTFFADGFEGQNVFIIPSKKLVIVRLGLSKSGEYDTNNFLAGIINAVH